MTLRLLFYMLIVLGYVLGLIFLLHSKRRTLFLLGCVGVVLYIIIIVDAWGVFDRELFPFSENVWKATLFDFLGWGAVFLIFLFVNAITKDNKDRLEKEAKKQENDSHKVIEITVTVDKGETDTETIHND